jgi:hypothetical protein
MKVSKISKNIQKYRIACPVSSQNGSKNAAVLED